MITNILVFCLFLGYVLLYLDDNGNANEEYE